MLLLAATCAFGGLILGVSTNIRMFAVIVLLIALAAFVAGLAQGGSVLSAVAWGITSLVSVQVGYMAMIAIRAVWRDLHARRRQRFENAPAD